MKPYYERDGIVVYHGDAADVLPTLEAESISAVISDPPAGIAFMSKSWDRDKGGRDQWVAWLASILSECNRTMKPGAHAVIWALPRTSGWTHRAIEDAGLDVRDCVTHLFGSGFPKSHDVSKHIDKMAGAEREVIGQYAVGGTAAKGGRQGRASVMAEGESSVGLKRDLDITAPATPEAEQWQGWGTALKPAAEFWYLARKPLSGTVAANVLAHGTGALNIDQSRVQGDPVTIGLSRAHRGGKYGAGTGGRGTSESYENTAGRWPPNVLMDDTAAALLDAQSGESTSKRADRGKGIDGATFRNPNGAMHGVRGHNDKGGASRFYPVLPIDDPDTLRFLYQPKASRAERNAGLDGLPERDSRRHGDTGPSNNAKPNGQTAIREGNHHPTVKPLALMSWLLTLVTPPGGTVLDPFAGSGTTGVAAAQLGVPCVLIEQEEEYLPIIAGRIDHALDARAGAELPLFAGVAD